MPGLEGGQLGGKRADDAAGRAGLAGPGCWAGGRGGCLLPGAEVLDPGPDREMAGEEFQRDPGGAGEPAEGDLLPGADELVQPGFGALRCGLVPAGDRGFQVGGVAGPGWVIGPSASRR